MKIWCSVSGFSDISTLVGHSVSSPRERQKRDRRDSRRDEREEQGRKRNRNEIEETKEKKHSPSTFTCYKDSRSCPTLKPISVGRPGDVRYTTPSHHPTTPLVYCNLAAILHIFFPLSNKLQLDQTKNIGM